MVAIVLLIAIFFLFKSKNLIANYVGIALGAILCISGFVLLNQLSQLGGKSSFFGQSDVNNPTTLFMLYGFIVAGIIVVVVGLVKILKAKSS